MSETATIRLATEADTEAIIDINRESLVNDYVNGKDLTPQFWQDRCNEEWAKRKTESLASFMQSSQNAVFVAETDNTVAGYARVTGNECAGNYVRHAQRRRGMASGIMVQVLGEMEAAGHSTAWAGVADADFAKAAHHFYQQCGFTFSGEKLPVLHNGRPDNFDDIKITLADIHSARHKLCTRLGVSAIAPHAILVINLKPKEIL